MYEFLLQFFACTFTRCSLMLFCMSIRTQIIFFSIIVLKFSLNYLYTGVPSLKRKESWFISVSWCKYRGWFYWICIFVTSHALCIRNSWLTALCVCLQDLLASFMLQVDPFSSVSAAHDIGENVRHQIHKSHPTVAEIFIHIGLSHSFINFLLSQGRNLFIVLISIS